MQTRQQPWHQTRFQRLIVRSSQRLQGWASNPWRRLSLLLIVLLVSFSVGGAVGSLTGALAQLDPLSALVSVLVIEVAARIRGPLLRQGGNSLTLELLDMGRIGLLYGLLLDGFKML
jgi:hypothetical protein